MQRVANGAGLRIRDVLAFSAGVILGVVTGALALYIGVASRERPFSVDVRYVPVMKGAIEASCFRGTYENTDCLFVEIEDGTPPGFFGVGADVHGDDFSREFPITFEWRDDELFLGEGQGGEAWRKFAASKVDNRTILLWIFGEDADEEFVRAYRILVRLREKGEGRS